MTGRNFVLHLPLFRKMEPSQHVYVVFNTETTVAFLSHRRFLPVSALRVLPERRARGRASVLCRPLIHGSDADVQRPARLPPHFLTSDFLCVAVDCLKLRIR